MPVDHQKKRIALNFSEAVQSYDRVSDFQKDTACALAKKLAFFLKDKQIQKTCEFGCGTGHLTTYLQQILPSRTVNVVSDIALPMVKQVAQRQLPHFLYCVMDAEYCSLKDGQYDLVASSLSAQWCFDLPRSLQKWYDLLAPGGMLAVTLLGSQTFATWRALCYEWGRPLGLANKIYPQLSEFRAMLPNEASIDLLESHQTVQEISSGMGFFRSLKQLGAQAIPLAEYSSMTPRQLKRSLAGLDEVGHIEYEVIYCVLEKPRPNATVLGSLKNNGIE